MSNPKGKAMDKGPWEVYVYKGADGAQRVSAISQDFDLDAMLTITGDFTHDSKLKYAEWLVDTLNRSREAETIEALRAKLSPNEWNIFLAAVQDARGEKEQ